MTLSKETRNWLTTFPSPSFLLDETPLFGYCPSFPFNEFSKVLKSQTSFDLDVTPGALIVRSPEQFLEGFGAPLIKKISIAPLEDAITFIYSKEDLKDFFRQVVDDGIEADEEYIEAFDLFITANILTTLQRIPFDNSLSYHVSDENGLPSISGLCQDLHITLNNRKIFARLILPNNFLRSWRERFAIRRLDTLLQRALAKKIDVTLHFEVGRVTLKANELKKVKKGDFVTLDQCHLNPIDYSGRVLITLNGKPLFRGKLKDNGLKIYEYPFYQEERAPMKDENTDWEEDEEEFEEDEDDSEEEYSEDEEEDESELESEEEYSEEESSEEEESEEEETKASKPITKSEPKIPLDEIPIEIVVELGRLKLPLQKLMELQIGNHLELSLRKEDAVDLVVNGKCFAKAELLALGDTLGVRILDI